MSKLTWKPEIEVVVNGSEIEALAQLTELYDVPKGQISLSQENYLFARARTAVSEILKRMLDQGLCQTDEEPETNQE